MLAIDKHVYLMFTDQWLKQILYVIYDTFQFSNLLEFASWWESESP